MIKRSQQEEIKNLLQVLIRETEKETITTVDELISLLMNEFTQKQFI